MSNREPLEAYRALLSELVILREAEGGELPEELESAYVERLDALWWRLSETEQQAFEAELAGAAQPTAPDSLNLVDCSVGQHGTSAPRSAA
jgi:hypothetical protein